MAVYLDVPGYAPSAAPASELLRTLPRSTPGIVGLWEIGHPSSGISGVPATGTSVPDLAADWVDSTLGATAPEFDTTNTAGGAHSFIQRTPKGGLHVASAHTGAVAPYQNFIIGLGAARANYLNTHAAAGDSIYVSIWAAVTRDPKAGYTDGVPVAGVRRGSNVSDLYAAVGVHTTDVWTSPGEGSARTVGRRAIRTGANVYAAVTAKTALASAYANVSTLASLGPGKAAELNALPSLVLYRVFVENLTATGRTHADVDALDYAEYQREVLTPGGRYYGDTWTNPTSVVA